MVVTLWLSVKISNVTGVSHDFVGFKFGNVLL